MSADEALGGKFTVINIPGCPPNPYNFLSTVLYILTFKKLPDLDKQNRPQFAYRRLIHEGCERRAHFDAGRFALEFGDDGHRRGWCLYKLGCKGPETYNNCPEQLFGDVGPRSWPVGTGCPCFGCSEKGVGFTKPIPEQASLAHFTPAGLPLEEGGKVRVGGGELRFTPPTAFAPIEAPEGHGATTAAVGLVAGLAGVGGGRRRGDRHETGQRKIGPRRRDREGLAHGTISRRDFLKVSASGGLVLASSLSPVPVAAREPIPRLPEAKGILYDATVCIGCKACMAACKEYNHLPPDHCNPDSVWDDPVDLSSKTYNIVKLYTNGTGAGQRPGDQRLLLHPALLHALRRSLLRLRLPGIGPHQRPEHRGRPV